MTEAIKSEAPAPAEASEAPKVAAILETVPESAPKSEKKKFGAKFFLYAVVAVGGFFAWTHYKNKRAKQERLAAYENEKRKNPLMVNL